MDVSEAFQILQLHDTSATDITVESVKRSYHKLALKYHPDKNGNTPESTQRFQELNQAYTVVMDVVSSDSSSIPHAGTDFNYFDILTQFMKSMFKGSGVDESLYVKIKELVLNCQGASLRLFDNIDRETSLTIYQFLCGYKSFLHVSDETLEKVKAIIQAKFNELSIYTIEPTLDDLMKDNLYKLKLDDETFLVPLWHREMYFEKKKNVAEGNDAQGSEVEEILVLCNPKLPEGYEIDEENRLVVPMEVKFTTDLLDREDIRLTVCSREFSIPMSQVLIKKTQTIRIRRSGILKIKEKIQTDERDVAMGRSDIFVKLVFF